MALPTPASSKCLTEMMLRIQSGAASLSPRWCREQYRAGSPAPASLRRMQQFYTTASRQFETAGTGSDRISWPCSTGSAVAGRRQRCRGQKYWYEHKAAISRRERKALAYPADGRCRRQCRDKAKAGPEESCSTGVQRTRRNSPNSPGSIRRTGFCSQRRRPWLLPAVA